MPMMPSCDGGFEARLTYKTILRTRWVVDVLVVVVVMGLMVLFCTPFAFFWTAANVNERQNGKAIHFLLQTAIYNCVLLRCLEF